MEDQLNEIGSDGWQLCASVGDLLIFGRAATKTSRPTPSIGPERLDLLTPRQLDMVKLLSQGLGNRQIADAMGIKDQSVKNHVSQVLIRLGLENRTQLALLYFQATEGKP